MEVHVTLKPPHGESCELHLADPEAVRAIVAAGPQKMYDDALAACFQNAAFQGKLDMVQMMLSVPDMWTPSTQVANRALNRAAINAHLRCVEELMRTCPMISPGGFTEALSFAVDRASSDDAKRIVARLVQDGRADPVQVLMEYINEGEDNEDDGDDDDDSFKIVGYWAGVRVLLAPESGWVPTVEVAEAALHAAAVVNNNKPCTETMLKLCPHITAQACSRVLDTVVQESCCAASRVEVVETLLEDGRAVPSKQTLIAVAKRGACAEMRAFAPHFVTALTAEFAVPPVNPAVSL
jgi:hypothetical protein